MEVIRVAWKGLTIWLHQYGSGLEANANTIIESLVDRLVRTLAHARQKITEPTGIHRSDEQFRHFLPAYSP